MRTIGLRHLLRHLPFMTVAVCALLLLAPMAGRAQDAGALAFLQSVYKTYQTSETPLDYLSETKASRYFVPSLAKLIGRDVAESKKCGCVVNLDFDPFINGQDWAKTAIDIKVTPGATPDRATGAARYVFPGGTEETVITLDLQKTAAGWRIADIRWSNASGSSLVKLLSKKS
jgi:hypothetical protein